MATGKNLHVAAQKPYTTSGLARALGTSRQTLKNYADRDE
jgi:hypothetical protein